MIEDVTDPGLVNVENQAYPAVLDVPHTLVPADFGELLAASLFAPNPALGVPATTFPTPSRVDVANQPPAVVPFGGFAIPKPTEVNVALQDLVGVDVDEFVVCELDENIQTNETPETIVEFTVLSVADAETFGPVVTPGTRLVRLTVSPSLSPFGVSFLLKQGEFDIAPRAITGASNTAPIIINAPNHDLGTGMYVQISDVLGNTAANGLWTITVLTLNTFRLDGSVGNGVYAGGGTITLPYPVPRTFVYYNPNNLLVIEVIEDGISFAPKVGDTVAINIARVGFEVVSKNMGLFVDNNVSTGTQPGPFVGADAPARGFQGNVEAGSGVENPFIGSGTRAPRLLGTFQVADQSLVVGLPENVNVG